MAFKNMEWEFSNEVERAYVEPEAGLRYLYITDAKYDPNLRQYDIFVSDMHNEAEFRLRYWVDAIDKSTGQFKPDYKQRANLIRLGKALAGPDMQIGIPNPLSIIGGIVKAEVELAPNKDGTRFFPRVVEYYPVEKDIADLAGIEQYYEDSGTEEGSYGSE